MYTGGPGAAIGHTVSGGGGRQPSRPARRAVRASRQPATSATSCRETSWPAAPDCHRLHGTASSCISETRRQPGPSGQARRSPENRAPTDTVMQPPSVARPTGTPGAAPIHRPPGNRCQMWRPCGVIRRPRLPARRDSARRDHEAREGLNHHSWQPTRIRKRAFFE